MQNVTTKIVGNTLTVTIDLSKEALAQARPSASGKTRLLATTGGGLVLPAIAGCQKASLALNLMVS